MGFNGPGELRRARHVAPVATGLVFVVVASACLLSGHGHLLRIEDGNRASLHAHSDHGPAWNACSICSIAHHSSFAITAPRNLVREDRSIGPRLAAALPRAAELLTDERSPRAPPRADIG